MIKKLALWNAFCEENQIRERSALLFELSNGHVSLTPHGKDNRLVLQRSQPTEAMVVAEADKVLEDCRAGQWKYDGLIYMMYWMSNEQVSPLYIGKAEKIGHSQGKLSANISTSPSVFCRWGYGYDYHIGDLSAVVCPDHLPSKIKPEYRMWADRLFESWPTRIPCLRQPTFFWIEAWERGKTGIWKEYGETSLAFLEYLLIGVANDLFPGTLLNNLGVNRK